MGITIGFVLYFIVINLDLNFQSTIKKYGKPSAISKWKPLELNSIESILNQTTDPRSNDLLFDQVRIVCIVMDDSFNKLRAEEIQMTWGQRCNKLVFTNTENGILLYFFYLNYLKNDLIKAFLIFLRFSFPFEESIVSKINHF